MRTPSGDLIIDYGDNSSERVSGSFVQPQPSGVNENTTTYTLFPDAINEVPIITKGVYEASIPQIIREEAAVNNSYNSNLYLSSDGFVRAVVGSNFVLRVEAIQPNTYNVENGVPTIIPRTEQITYTWSKDGIQLQNNTKLYADTNDTSSYVEVLDNELKFVNTKVGATGGYVCDVANDIGSVTSELIDLEILDPTDTAGTDFFINLVQNAFGENGSDSWSSIQGNVESKELLQDTETEKQEVALKRPENQQQGFVADQFYPHPANITTTNIRNYDVYQIAKGSAKYLTREKLAYLVANGIKKVAVYQDIDVTNVQNYIQGSVYGVDGVRAFFGCYLGNSLTRSIPVREAVPLINRENSAYYFQGAPRISVENFLTAGGGAFGESLQVILQEFNGDVPLSSRIIDDKNVSHEVQQVVLLDPITKKLQELQKPNRLVSQYPEDIYGVGYTLKPTDPENVVLSVYKELYGSVDRYYTQGQYVEFNPVYLEKLNKKTTKVRITIIFDVNDPRFSEYIWYDPRTEDLADLLVFDNTNITGTFKSQPNTYDSTNTRNLVYDVVQQTIDGQLAEQNGSLQQAFNNGSISKTLATGFVFGLFPMTKSTRPFIGRTNLEFRKNIIGLPTKDQDVRVKTTPINTNKKFTLTGLRYERWKVIFDMRLFKELNQTTQIDIQKLNNGGYATGIGVQKYNKRTGVFENQRNFPTFTTNARSVRYAENSRTPTTATGISAVTSNSINTRFGGVDYKGVLFQDSSDLGKSYLETLPSVKNIQPSNPQQTWTLSEKLIKSDMATLPNDKFDGNWNYRAMFEVVGTKVQADANGSPITTTTIWYVPKNLVIAQGQQAPYVYTWTSTDFTAPSGLDVNNPTNDYKVKATTKNSYGLAVDLNTTNDNGNPFDMRFVNLATVYKNPTNPTTLKNLENFIYDEDANGSVLHMFEYEYLY